MSVAEGVGVDIERAETAGDYRLRLAFSDGHSVTGDFESFLRHSRNPGVRDYLEAGRFAQFALVDGNLVWGDYEMVFPIDDLYAGDLLHGRGETEAALAVAEVPAAYGRTTRRSGGHARKSRRE